MNLTAQDEIAVYVEGVRLALAGLPAETRDELLEDLPEHLAEVLAEGGGSLEDRLGPPDVYAAELSASAGLGATTAPPRTDARSRAAAKAAAHRARLAGRVRVADEFVGRLLGYPRARDFLVLLRPAWWVLRGYLAAMAVSFFVEEGSTTLGLLPRINGELPLGILLLGVAVIGSVWLGGRGGPASRGKRRVLKVASAVLVFFAVIGFFEADEAARRDFYEQVGNVQSRYDNVQDVFVYDKDGKLLDGVQLYDQEGRAVHFGDGYCWDEATSSYLTAPADGYPVCPANAPFPAEASAVPAEASVAPGVGG
ncbi:HAAS signaling domain-containing protein [Actinoplanes sp. G11-F43]|uniref:HAAS signaling domain-containing protein n=1 Tax=Actinoplanes sp. G11-F43 TaxID=3424130 RepID=UPI003D33818D